MWIWFIVASVCLGLELLTGTLYLLFIAIGLVGGGVTAQLGFPLYAQFLVAALLIFISIFGLRLFGIRRRSELASPTSDGNMNLDIGSTVFVSHWEADRTATVSYRGAQWKAQLADNVQAAPVPATYSIQDIQGLTLIVVPK